MILHLKKSASLVSRPRSYEGRGFLLFCDLYNIVGLLKNK